MKTIKFTGEMPISFGVAGSFTPGQDPVTVENDLADNLIDRGYFKEVVEEKEAPNKPAKATLAESTI